MSSTHSLSTMRRDRARFAALLGVATFTALALMGYPVWSAREEAIRAAEITTRNYAAVLEARLDAALRRADAHLQELVRDLPVAALNKQAVPRHAGTLDAALDTRLLNFEELAGLRVYDADGELLYTTASEATARINVADRSFFSLARDGPRDSLAFSEVLIGRTMGRPTLVVARALRDGQGTFRGIANAAVELEYFQKLFRSLDIGAQGIVVIRRSDDFTQVVRWPPLDSQTNKPLAPGLPIRQAISAGKKAATTAFTVNVDGVSRILSFRKLERYPFFVVTAMGRDDVLSGWRTRSLAVGGAGLLLLGLLAAVLLRLSRSEARQAQAITGLSASEANLRAITENTSAGITIFQDGRRVFANRGATDMLGYTIEEFLPLALNDVIHPDSLDLVLDRHRRRAAGEAVPSHYEFTALAKDGRAVPVEGSYTVTVWNGRPAIMVFTTDITERKRAEDALRASEEKFSKVFHASPDSMTISRLESGELLEVNAGFEHVTGHTRDEAVGRTVIELGLWNKNVRRSTLFEQAASGEAMTMRRKDGGERMITIWFDTIEIDGEKFVLTVARDITGQKKAERERAVLEAQLRQSQKMEAVGTLAGGIAHDFNNIIGTILGNAALARADVGTDHRALESIIEIDKAGRRARDLVQQILAFSRKQALSRSIIALGPVVEEALRLLRATLPASVQLAVSCAPETPNVSADPTQIHQVLVNLCTNAWHAMEGRPGNIDVHLEEVTVDAALAGQHAGLRPGRYVRLSVKDNGKGMDATTTERVFEPFFTTKGVDEGTGLGLSVVHGIVQGHEGAITVDSAPGKGTTFQLYFPAAE